jgi:capsular exopolysaccharide synthesis family protein
MTMSRIQQILSKAERDGTARRIAPMGETIVRTPAAVQQPEPYVEEDEEAVADEPIESVSYAAPLGTAQVSSDVLLDPLLVAALHPLEPAAEQYRTLRGRIAQAENGQPIRVIQVTSPSNGDGKTITSVNLALTMAQEFQRRVLVVDADLRQPRVHQLFNLEAGPGLVDVLTGAAALEEALVEIPQYHLTVLRAGRSYDRPAEMLGSGPMRRLMDGLRTQFDRIVVDSAPATVADPVAFAPLADRLLLVVRAGSTTKPAIARALGALASTKLLGLVFNESGATVPPRYEASA